MSLEAVAVPPEFLELVRDALAHLYEPAHLVRHPLKAMLAGALPMLHDPAQALRLFMLDAIERLEPDDATPLSEKARRPYLVLVQRYVGGLSPDEVAAKLQIGDRQFRREHQKGLEALAAYLWSHSRQATPAAGSDEEEATANLATEMASLGLELSSLSLAEVAAAARQPAEALARHYGVVLHIALEDESPRCLCDRALSKQALISCLDALMALRPRCLTVTPRVMQRRPCIQLSPAPPLTAEARERLESSLIEPRTLTSAQGGEIELSMGEGALPAGLWLLFRPESLAHVLVVDDDEKMLRLYERYLAVGRYSVDTATSAREAASLLEVRRPDAILVDIMMRDVDGWELLQSLRSRPMLAGIPVIVCSIVNEPALATALGAQAYLRKPITADVLLSTLKRVLDESSRAGQRPAEP